MRLPTYIYHAYIMYWVYDHDDVMLWRNYSPILFPSVTIKLDEIDQFIFMTFSCAKGFTGKRCYRRYIDPCVCKYCHNYSVSNNIMADEKFASFAKYQRYCSKLGTSAFSITSAIIYASYHFAWFLPKLPYLSMPFILNLVCTARSAGQFRNKWHAQIGEPCGNWCIMFIWLCLVYWTQLYYIYYNNLDILKMGRIFGPPR